MFFVFCLFFRRCFLEGRNDLLGVFTNIPQANGIAGLSTSVLSIKLAINLGSKCGLDLSRSYEACAYMSS